jgi:hypothetical protein
LEGMAKMDALKRQQTATVTELDAFLIHPP